MTRNLVGKRRIVEAQAESLRLAREAVSPEAMVTGDQRQIREVRNDPKDRHVAAARVGAELVGD